MRVAVAAPTALFLLPMRSAPLTALMTRLVLASGCVAAAALPLSGCIVEAPGTDGTGRAGPTPRAVVKDVPPLNVKLGANLDGKVEILGAKLEPGRAQPGDTVKITTYFKVLEPLEQDYIVFMHVEDGEGRGERINLDHTPGGGTHPTSQWKAGQTVEDTVSLYVPPTSTADALNIWMGLWHAGTDTRLPLANKEQVKNDGKDRILLTRLPVRR